jgi:cell division protease FtsH
MRTNLRDLGGGPAGWAVTVVFVVTVAFFAYLAIDDAVNGTPPVGHGSTDTASSTDTGPVTPPGKFDDPLAQLTYPRLLDAMAAGAVTTAEFGEDNTVTVTFVDGTRALARYPTAQAPAVVAGMLNDGVEVRTAATSPWTTDPPTVVGGGPNLTLIGLLIVVVVLVVLQLHRTARTRGGDHTAKAVTAGGAEDRAEQRRRGTDTGQHPEPPDTRFEDVAGCAEAVEDLTELVAFLQDPERFERMGAKIPRGALLCGPPGTGKTLLARAVAGEAGVPMFTATGSDFVEMYVGVGAKRIRELFAKARRAGPAIVFIDEIDACGRARETGPRNGGTSESDQTLIALLNELDGFVSSELVVIAATNRPDVLDPALLRPGRLDRKIQVPLPDRAGRERILGVHCRNKPLAGDVDLATIAQRTPGMSGAELEAVANEAAIEAVRRDLTAVDQSCFDAAVATVAMGRERRSAVVTDTDRKVTAWHEAGHTVAAMVEPDAADPVAVSIVPRGPAGGVTWVCGSDNQFLSRRQAFAQLVVALGGRAAEEIVLDGEHTQGASGDLEQATALATAMVTRFGMTRRGLAVRPGAARDERTAETVDELLRAARDRARAVLAANRALLDDVVAALLADDTLGRRELDALRARHHGGRSLDPFDVDTIGGPGPDAGPANGTATAASRRPRDRRRVQDLATGARTRLTSRWHRPHRRLEQTP